MFIDVMLIFSYETKLQALNEYGSAQCICQPVPTCGRLQAAMAVGLLKSRSVATRMSGITLGAIGAITC